MLPEAECKGIVAKGMHLWVAFQMPTGERRECCYFCGRPRPEEEYR